MSPGTNVVIALAISSIVIVVISFRNKLVYRQRRDLHGCEVPPSLPQLDPVFGLDLILSRFTSLKADRRNVSLLEQFRRHGNTFQSITFGRTTFFTIEPRNLQSVLSTDFLSWGVEPMRLFAFEPFIGKGIMCSDGAFWEHSRALIKPTFARTQIADLHLDDFGVHVERLIDLIPKDGSTFDLQPLFARLALDSSTEFLFGESVQTLAPDLTPSSAESFLEAYDYGQSCVGRRIQLPKFNFLTTDSRFWKSCQTAHEFVDQQIQKALLVTSKQKQDIDGRSRYILAQELLRQTHNLLDIRHQLLNIFLPAHEAVGVALTNIFFNLARHPRIYTNLRNEILAADLKARNLTFERLKSLKYLQFVINETFRLNPTIGTNTRMALKDTILPTGGGPSGHGTSPILVRKGDSVVFGFYGLHRMPNVFGDDVDVFRPERWEKLRPAHWSYLPFGGGFRVCPGQQLALTEIGYCLVRMVQAFERVENRDPTMEFVEHYKITTESKNGAKVAMVPSHL